MNQANYANFSPPLESSSRSLGSNSWLWGCQPPEITKETSRAEEHMHQWEEIDAKDLGEIIIIFIFHIYFSSGETINMVS